MVIEGFIDPEVSWRLRERLEARVAAGDTPAMDLRTRHPRNHLLAIGHPAAPSPLQPQGPALDWYLEQAARAGAWIDELLAPELRWQEALEACCNALSGGRRLGPPEAGGPWGRSSIRGFGPGAGFLPHFEAMYTGLPP